MENLPDFNALWSDFSTWASGAASTAMSAGGTGLEFVRTEGGTFATQLLAIDLPIPDVAMLFAFGLICYAGLQKAKMNREQTRVEIETLYNAELLQAHRRTHQAKGELRKAELAIERERQKRRREARGIHRTARRPAPQLVETTTMERRA